MKRQSAPTEGDLLVARPAPVAEAVLVNYSPPSPSPCPRHEACAADPKRTPPALLCADSRKAQGEQDHAPRARPAEQRFLLRTASLSTHNCLNSSVHSSVDSTGRQYRIKFERIEWISGERSNRLRGPRAQRRRLQQASVHACV